MKPTRERGGGGTVLLKTMGNVYCWLVKIDNDKKLLINLIKQIYSSTVPSYGRS